MKLSIVTISQNTGTGLRDTVHSVLMQSRLPDECVIQDGASTDDSVETLQDWLEWRWGGAEVGLSGVLSSIARRATGEASAKTEGRRSEVGCRVWGQDCNVRIRSEVDGGIYAALNRGIARAEGDVIGLLHAGDAYARSDVLAMVMDAFADGAEAVYGDLQYIKYIDGNIRLVRHWRAGAYDCSRLRWGWMPPHPTLFLKREVYARAAVADGVFFDPAFLCAGDYDFMLRVLSQLQVPPVYIPRVLVRMQTGGISNRNFGNLVQKSREDWVAIRQNKIGSIHTLLAKNLRKVGQFRVTI